MSPALTIRPAVAGDAAAIAALYNHFVATCTCTWQTESDTAEARLAWLGNRDARHPAYIAEDEAGRLAGFAALSPYSTRGGFSGLAEVAIYLAPAAQGQGLGSRLMGTLMDAAKAGAFHALVARVSGDQPASLALHAKFGFAETGRLPEAGLKFGKRLDLVYLHRLVSGPGLRASGVPASGASAGF